MNAACSGSTRLVSHDSLGREEATPWGRYVTEPGTGSMAMRDKGTRPASRSERAALPYGAGGRRSVLSSSVTVISMVGWILTLALSASRADAAAHPSVVPPTPDPEPSDDGPDPSTRDTIVSSPDESAPEPDEPPDAGVRRVIVRSHGDGLSASARTIGPEVISTTPKRSADDLLRLVPGLVLLQHGNQGKGYQLYLRGFDAVHGSDVEMRVEGIPLNEPSNVHAHGYLDPTFVIPEVVYAIDARKGAYRLDQGNFATAGSIEYRLGVPVGERGIRTGYEIGSTNRHRGVVVYAPRWADEATFLAVEALHDQGFGDNRRAKRVSALSQARLWSNAHSQLDALAGVYSASFGLPGTLRLDDHRSGERGFYDAYLDDTGGQSQRALVGLRVRGHKGRSRGRMQVYAKARRLMLDENFTGALLFGDAGDRHRQVQHAGAAGAVGTLGVRVHERVEVESVAQWQGNLIEQRQDQLFETGQSWDVSRDLNIAGHALSIGPGLRALPTDWLLLRGGVRFDVFHQRVSDALQGGQTFAGTQVAISPRFTSAFQLGPRWQLFAAYGRGFRSPEARAVTLPPAPQENVDLSRFVGGAPRMTLTDNAEVGARWQPSELFDVGASAFGIWIERESIFDHVSGFNVERSGTRRYGVEADAQIRPARWANLGVDLTYVHGRFINSGAPIPGAPPLIVSMFGNVAHPDGWRAGIRWLLLGPRPLSYGAKAGVLTVLDTSVGYRHRFVQVDLAVDNILGLRWREGEYNYASWWVLDEPRSQIPTIHYVAGYPRMARLSLSLFF